ncbi:MAG: DUF2147 domain-containing protein [Verrucomicrobiota bacterium]
MTRQVWLTVLVSIVVGAWAMADPIEGTWLKTDGEATIELKVVKGKLQGTLVDWAAKERTIDDRNPDPKLRKRPLKGMVMVEGFSKKGAKWEGGTVYDSNKGKTYQGKIWMEGQNKLMMRGFIGISLIGRSAEWKRLK